MSTPKTIHIKVVAVDPPFGPNDGVLFGMQTKKDVDDPAPAAATTEFDIEIDVIPGAPGGHDFKGPYVHGRKGDRFLYLSWGLPDPVEPFVMFARAKLKLSEIPADLLDTEARLICELDATNHKRQPATGTIRSPAVRWRRQG